MKDLRENSLGDSRKVKSKISKSQRKMTSSMLHETPQTCNDWLKLLRKHLNEQRKGMTKEVYNKRVDKVIQQFMRNANIIKEVC